jgi:hypothetical protein
MLAQPRPVLGVEAGKLGAQCPICRAAFVGVARAQHRPSPLRSPARLDHLAQMCSVYRFQRVLFPAHAASPSAQMPDRHSLA